MVLLPFYLKYCINQDLQLSILTRLFEIDVKVINFDRKVKTYTFINYLLREIKFYCKVLIIEYL